MDGCTTRTTHACRATCVLLMGLLAVAAPATVLAQQSQPPAAQPAAKTSPVILDQPNAQTGDELTLPEGFDPGVGPTLLAVFPGVLLHGSGLWAAGAEETAYDLARIEALGLLTSTLGLLGVYATGASKHTIELLYYPSLVGLSAFIMPWFADIYGSSVGGRSADARLVLPPVEARAGYAYIHDPIFEYSHFSYVSAEMRLEPVRFVPTAWVALNDDNQRFRLEANTRLLGPRASERPGRLDGSFLDIETAATYHNFGTENFETLILEASLAGRYDMRRLSPVLRGSFYELALGLGGQLHGYSGTELGEDFSGLLLMRTAYGVYFGPSGDRYGEAKLYYDHRHDDFVAGSGFNSDIDGLFGSVGLRGFYYLDENWGLFGDLRAAAAYMALAGVTFRYGDN